MKHVKEIQRLTLKWVNAKPGDEAKAIWKEIQALLSAPIPMILFCPKCQTQHIDAPTPENLETYDSGADIEYIRTPAWTNPPHRSHLCSVCATIWRPADVPTVGVESIETKGKDDNWTPAAIPDECVASGQSCSYAPEGPNGEMQCHYCGKSQEAAIVSGQITSYDKMDKSSQQALDRHLLAQRRIFKPPYVKPRLACVICGGTGATTGCAACHSTGYDGGSK